MIEDTSNPQSTNGGGDRSLGISFVSRLEPKTLKHSSSNSSACLDQRESGVVLIKCVARTIPNDKRNKKMAACVSSKSMSLLITSSATSKRSLLTNFSVNS